MRSSHPLRARPIVIGVAEACLRCGVCCAVETHFCHVQFEEEFDERYTYVYHCLSTPDPASNQGIWLCTACHKCEEVCPYETSPLRFIEAAKAEAYKRGLAPRLLTGIIAQITSTGYLFPITPSTVRRRAELGLKPLTTEAAEELRQIALKTGLTEPRGEP